MTNENDYTVGTFRTYWTDIDNITINLYHHADHSQQVGIIEVKIANEGYRHFGKALLWNLWVSDEHRGKGCGRMLLDAALKVAEEAGCKVAELTWDHRDTPEWVLNWYLKRGFCEKEFGSDDILLEKKL